MICFSVAVEDVLGIHVTVVVNMLSILFCPDLGEEKTSHIKLN